jgi:hypothetical protein
VAFDAEASRYVDPDSVAPLEGTSTLVLGGCALATCTGRKLMAAVRTSAAETRTGLGIPMWTSVREDDPEDVIPPAKQACNESNLPSTST